MDIDPSSQAEQALPLIEIFAQLDAAEMTELAARFETRSLKRGEAVIRQGEPADALYIVVSGRFSVTRTGRRTPIAEIGPDQPIGEIGFITHSDHRTATVTAMRDSIVLRLDRKDFEQLTRKYPMIWRSLAMTLAGRLAATTAAAPSPPDPRPRTIAIIRAGDSPQPMAFYLKMATIFETSGKTLVLDSQSAPDAVKVGAKIESAAATRALNALEAGADYVLFLADPEPTAWSEKVIRHADLVLAVGEHDCNHEINGLEKLAAKFLAADAARLVLLHPRRERVSGTSRWLAGRSIAMHHHVALNDPKDFARLFRFISGEARGLVACGGGALCATHIGDLPRTRRAGLWSSTSWAARRRAAPWSPPSPSARSPDEIDRRDPRHVRRQQAMRRYTRPRYSLLDHATSTPSCAATSAASTSKTFGFRSTLSRPTCPATSFTFTAAASCGRPSAPQLHSGAAAADLHQRWRDAGRRLPCSTTFPCASCTTSRADRTSSSVFTMPELERFNVAYDTLPSRAALMRSAINPMRRVALPQAPGLATVLMRSLMANRQDYQRHIGDDDILLVPPIAADIGFLDWHRHVELVKSGYDWTLTELQRRQNEAATFKG